MKLIYSLINRSSKADGVVEFKIEIDKNDYALLKYFEGRESTVFAEFKEDEIKYNSENLRVENRNFQNKIISFNLSIDLFQRVEKENIWESSIFIVNFVTLNITPRQLFEVFKKQIESKMSELKARVQPEDDLCWEDTLQLEY